MRVLDRRSDSDGLAVIRIRTENKLLGMRGHVVGAADHDFVVHFPVDWLVQRDRRFRANAFRICPC